MIKSFCAVLLWLSCLGLVTSCSSIVEPIKLPASSSGISKQENFEIQYTALNLSVAEKLNTEKYERLVSMPGQAFSADIVKETDLTFSQFPHKKTKKPYLLGVGDELRLIQYAVDVPALGEVGGVLDLNKLNTTDLGASSTSSRTLSSTVISTNGRISSDGSLFMIGVGRIDAEGRGISELRNDIRSVLIRNGRVPNFQIEVSAFNSKKCYVTLDTPSQPQSTNVIPITDQDLTLRELIASKNILLNKSLLTIVKLQRQQELFTFELESLLSPESIPIVLQDKDHIFIQHLQYVPGKVYLVGGVKPSIKFIVPEKRETLAEVLVQSGGPMDIQTAQRSAIYLLRGQNPVRAFHLDAQNPARLLVADAIELRPNDIVFVGEQPINTFNRMLSTILPLRVFSRDVQNNNLP